MLKKQAVKFGVQWNKYISKVLWAYQNTPHSSTKEKPTFLLHGFDCHSPMEAALVLKKSLKRTNVKNYREQMILSLSSARKLAREANKGVKKHYKHQYDKTAKNSKSIVGN